MTAGVVLGWAVAIALAFLVGSVNPATLIARVLGTDLSVAGSGNPGATNAGRVLGRKWGVLVGVLDVLKGLVPTVIAAHWVGPHLAYAVGLAAVLGHIWSPFLHGRGGKGVATTLGAILGVHPLIAVVVLVVFALGFALTRWVAAGSILGAVAMLVIAVLVWTGHWPGDVWTGVWLTALALVVLARHKNNVVGWWRQRRVG
ncbi:acyl-phosphate glycerol-3-phosphate acyltransferase [Humibacillus xanthopallidus]|uniref:Glycerol-3-phosphate acyltransferase n=1 Tax=Humibacillus xanthopallidus TaxID=412689 RepID=A0A543PWD0_9MICO|nr:glycerol-3-phosphate acyltransferase [Humibacillus xanthopallidus]TQN48376.1 acyl-phosphate glycerol-3-phosphate acyltransferase [Humibacillus xanthopallidus]